jgi:RNA polymerase primary sigma factor
MAEMQRIPLRTAAEQKDLARVTRDPKRSLAERESARQALVEANLRFAFSVAKQYQGRGVELGDLVAEANSGLLRAVDKYDPDVGVNFISYAVWWIRQALQAAVTKQGRSVVLPLNRAGDLTRIARAREALKERLNREPSIDEIARVTELSPGIVRDLIGVMRPERSLDEPLRDRQGQAEGETLANRLAAEQTDETDSIVEGLEVESRRAALLRALDALPPRDRRVLMLYYGLEDGEPKTLQEIALRFGVTRERVRQLRERAIAALRRSGNADVLRREWAA